MVSYFIKKGEINDLDLIKPLWEKLNKLHLNLSPFFKNRFSLKTWEKRKTEWIKKSKKLLFEYVVNNKNNKVIGYCITTIDKEDDKVGEIDSIYIEESFRKSGIGKQLMNNAIHWLTEMGVKTQKLLVAVGNENVLDYYKKFDFYPLHIVLQRNKSE